jgi:hypothetical protein
VSVWKQDDEVVRGGGPALHALVIGVSRYANLPSGDKPAADEDQTLGLRQLECAAAGAYAFASWLAESYRNPEAPLGSIRLLLSPSPLEQQEIPDLPADVPPALSAEVKAALDAWAAACDSRSDNVAVLYAAGHGVMVSKEDGQIVLLEDFASSERSRFAEALDVPSVRSGMAGPTTARRQFYFVDACQVRPAFVRDVRRRPRGRSRRRGCMSARRRGRSPSASRAEARSSRRR